MASILVTGATGTIGGEIARVLLAEGMPVRVLLRDQAQASQWRNHAEVVLGDFSSPESLDAALEGIERVFLASFDRSNIADLQRNVLTAAKCQGVRQIVRMSTIAVHDMPQIPIFRWHSRCERQLEESGLVFTHLRPSWIMQNFLSFLVHDRIRLPAGEGRVAFIDARDVAAVAARALTVSGHENKAYELTGPESLSHGEVAARLASTLGRPVTYENIAPELYDAEKTAQGWPRSSIDSLLGLFAVLRAGTNLDADPNDTVLTVTDRMPFSFQNFAADYAADFKK